MWFKFYPEFSTDPRLGMLPHGTQLLYVHAMCATARRIAPCTDDRFAWWVRWDSADLLERKKVLMAVELITDEWVPIDWDERQPPIDRTNAERQRRHRERRRSADQVGGTEKVGNAVTDTLVTPTEERRGQERREEAIRGEGTTAGSAAIGSPTEPIERTPSPGIEIRSFLSDPSPKDLSSNGKRKSGDFEALLDVVDKVINRGQLPASDIDAIAKVTHLTAKQVGTAVRQLRDRGRIR
jgi:hypothetical protein